MIAFWLICAVLIVIALAFILPPLLQREEQTNTAQVKEANIAVYRDQLRELEADLRNGIVSEAQYRADRDELERRLLEDLSVGEHHSKRVKAPITSRNLAYALGVGLPVIAILFYVQLGNKNALSAAPAAAMQPGAAAAPFANQSGEMSPQRIQANVEVLAK